MRVHGRGGGGGGTPTGWPVGGYTNHVSADTAYGLTANRVFLAGLYLPAQIQFSTLATWISTPDNAHNSDIGLYNAAGTLICDIGAQAIASSGKVAFTLAGGPFTLGPGVIFYGATSAAAVLQLGVLGNSVNLFQNGSYVASAGGALPASITPPTLAVGQYSPALALY